MSVQFVGKKYNEYQANGSMTVYNSDKLCCNKDCRSNVSNTLVDQKCSNSNFHTFPYDNKFTYHNQAKHGCVTMCARDYVMPDNTWIKSSCLKNKVNH